MKEITAQSLAQIVSNDYHAATVFEKYQLDFCCKGKRSLEEACREKRLQVNEIVADLENRSGEEPAPVNFDELSLAQLIHYIINIHHRYVKDEMPAISGFLQKVAVKHGERYPAMAEVLFLFQSMKEEMEEHMQKEEIVLFPRIKIIERQLLEGKDPAVNSIYVQGPVHIMEQEHEHAGSVMAEIRQLTNDYTPPADACTMHRIAYTALQAFERDLHRHVHLENNILFPKALNIFETAGRVFI